MKKKHKFVSVIIILLVAITAYLTEAQMSKATALSLVTFFSVVFGFYMTSIAILYRSSYTKFLHKQINDKEQKRGTHILKSYLLVSSYCSVFSISTIILFSSFAKQNSDGFLSVNLVSFLLPILKLKIDLNFLLNSGLLGMAALNIFYMLLLLHTIIDGLIEEAKK